MESSNSPELGGAAWDPVANDLSTAEHGVDPVVRTVPCTPLPAKSSQPGIPIRGTVRTVQQRTESIGSESSLVWTFRVDEYDERGDVISQVPVQMRGRWFEGSLTDGDLIEIDQRRVPGGVIDAKEVRNLTTQSTVRSLKRYPMSKSARIAGVAILVIGVVIMLSFFAYVWSNYSANRDPSGGLRQNPVNTFREPEEDLRSVPSVGGMPVATATERLTNAGFTVKIRDMPSTLGAAGAVFATSPPGGFPARIGSSVEMLVPRSGRAQP